MATTVSLKELFIDTVNAIGEDPSTIVFRPQDEAKLNERFENGRWDTDPDDVRIDVMCWTKKRVLISCSHERDTGTDIYITSALRNPPEQRDLLDSVLGQLEDLRDLSDSEMRDGDTARDVAKALIKEIEPFIGD